MFIAGISWQEWVILLAMVGYVLLALVSVSLGSVYLGTCPDDDWVPYWLIVHGKSPYSMLE